jgi:hypothetical protein
MGNAKFYSAIATKERVDGGAGIIYGVSVITIGEAVGHEQFVDKTTLSQICGVASKFPDGIKVKLSQSSEHDGSAGQIVGNLRAFRQDGNHVRADLHLLKSDDNFQKIIEMASNMPSAFGLSVVIPHNTEELSGKDYIRCDDIYSIDLVEAPAANPTGLFSSKTLMSKENIKFANGKDGDHAKDCDCKNCMSAGKKKEMSAFIADMLGLSADSDEAAIKSAFTALVEKATAPAPAKKADPIPVMELSKDPVILALTKKLDETTAELARIQSGAVNQMALAKKTEIDTLLARASSEGRVVPFETADLYEVKDGVCTIHMEPSKLSKMIEKLPKDTITLSRKRGEAPKVNGSDNKPLNMDRSTPEGLKNTIAFCRRTREANEREFGAQIKRLALSDNGN